MLGYWIWWVPTMGASFSPKNNFRLVLFSTRYGLGAPCTSIMQASCSCSFSPGKSGYPLKTVRINHICIQDSHRTKCSIVLPVYSSAKMQPKLHISIVILYVIPVCTIVNKPNQSMKSNYCLITCLEWPLVIYRTGFEYRCILFLIASSCFRNQ